MANSEYEYTRGFEQADALPPSNWIVVRVDGRGFGKVSRRYGFSKPNEQRALELMNSAAVETVRALADVVVAYGQSDEYSFVFEEGTTLFERRSAKLATTVATLFTAEYCMQWPHFFPDRGLERPFPTFDGRCVCYPKRRILRDYLSWRQADCHINNLYNTTFWALVLKGGVSTTDAEQQLKGTVAADKNEILFGRFGINYNDEPQIFRKGTVVFRSYETDDRPLEESAGSRGRASTGTQSKTQAEKERKRKMKAHIAVEHVDIIRPDFWDARPYILARKRDRPDDE